MVSYLNERNIAEKKIKYVRFERKILDYGTENVFQFKSLKELIAFLNKFENKNILSTLGSNSLVELRGIEEKNNLFIRILPTAASIQNAEKLGYLPKNIIAMQGPFSKEMNVAILKNYKID
jgi:precorrin-6x reductase cbiJ/cobK